jgi:hypothetical protein
VFALTAEWAAWVVALAAPLHRRSARRLADVVVGILMASGRRTAASWWRAARIGDRFRPYYYFLGGVGRKAAEVAAVLLRITLDHVEPGGRLLFALDDTPTKRYGPKVQGAGIHHNPTPGPAGSKFLYGHSWVTLSRVARHGRFGAIGLPLLGSLYVRKKDVPTLPAGSGVVILEEADGSWRAFLCTDPEAEVEAIVQSVLDRWAIEQNYHDLKEVEGIGQVQLRRLWSNVGAFNLSLWAHTLIEAWAWERSAESLCDRSDRPWDDPGRRPSHADRRRALQREMLATGFQRLDLPQRWSEKIRHLLDGVASLVA